jgi:hypothetical protein
VQAELKLTEEQTKKVKQFGERLQRDPFRKGRPLSPEEWKAKFEELPAQEKALRDMLRPEQARRLRQVALQQRGPDAFNDPAVAQALRLTPEQREKVRKLHEEAHRFGPGGPRPGNPWEQIVSLLTDEQRAQWQELTGEPFKGKIQPPHPNFGGPWHGHRDGPPRGGPRRPDRSPPGGPDRNVRPTG